MWPHQGRVAGKDQITSLDLLATLFVMHPRVPLAFLATRARYLLIAILLSMSSQLSIAIPLHTASGNVSVKGCFLKCQQARVTAKKQFHLHCSVLLSLFLQKKT